MVDEVFCQWKSGDTINPVTCDDVVLVDDRAAAEVGGTQRPDWPQGDLLKKLIFFRKDDLFVYFYTFLLPSGGT